MMRARSKDEPIAGIAGIPPPSVDYRVRRDYTDRSLKRSVFILMVLASLVYMGMGIYLLFLLS